MDNETVLCEICGEGEVDEPCLDWCGGCHRKLCDDCIAGYDEGSGYRSCPECVEKLGAKGESR
jgi:hypothetical protein